MRNNTSQTLPQLPVVVGFAALAFLVFAPEGAQAQELFACYVPSSGVVYRIQGPDLKDECTGRNHVEFSWSTTGGAGVTRTVFSGECEADAAVTPPFGIGDGVTIEDGRIQVEDAPSVVAYITRTSEGGDESAFFQISGELLVIRDGQIVLRCEVGEIYSIVMIL